MRIQDAGSSLPGFRSQKQLCVRVSGLFCCRVFCCRVRAGDLLIFLQKHSPNTGARADKTAPVTLPPHEQALAGPSFTKIKKKIDAEVC